MARTPRDNLVVESEWVGFGRMLSAHIPGKLKSLKASATDKWNSWVIPMYTWAFSYRPASSPDALECRIDHVPPVDVVRRTSDLLGKMISLVPCRHCIDIAAKQFAQTNNCDFKASSL